MKREFLPLRADQPSRTAEYMALFRALESVGRADRRLFEDSFAQDFLRPRLRLVVRLARVPGVGRAIAQYMDRRWPGVRSAGVARTRLIDDAVKEAIRDGARQIVVLGAGFDSRAYRIPGIERTRVFEVDHPATSAAKQRLLLRRFPRLPEHVTYVTLDFNRDDLGQVLSRSGLSPTECTFFVWEGVTNYLDETAVDATLRVVATAAPGSRISFTYIHQGVLDRSERFFGTESVARVLKQAGEPWTFGIRPTELGSFLSARRLRLIQDQGADEFRERYWGSAAKRLVGYAFYRAALAEVMG